MKRVTILVTNKYKDVWKSFLKGLSIYEAGIDFELVRINGDVPNFSYSRLMNKGLATVDTDYVLFINDDVFPKTDNWLKKLVDRLDSGYKLVGPVSFITKEFSRGSQKESDSLVKVGSKEGVKSLSGGCLLCKTFDAKRINGWDENFEYYYEDNDFCRRMESIGDLCMSMDVFVHHPDQTTTSRDRELFQQKTKRSKEYYESKWGN